MFLHDNLLACEISTVRILALITDNPCNIDLLLPIFFPFMHKTVFAKRLNVIFSFFNMYMTQTDFRHLLFMVVMVTVETVDDLVCITQLPVHIAVPAVDIPGMSATVSFNL